MAELFDAALLAELHARLDALFGSGDDLLKHGITFFLRKATENLPVKEERKKTS